ncbi:MAG: hypothetical protein Q4F84_09575, partial [Fibrobacter sp.]|nr:hypothetical protein [Fibrobacter sp.]
MRNRLFQWLGIQGHRVIFALVFILSLNALLAQTPPAEVKPLRNGHSHNDYWRSRPLQDALDNGFCSVEADVFLRKGEFLV